MDIWSKARSFAQEAAKRSQELTMEAAKRSQEISIGGSRLTDIVSVASKRSMELAAEASKHADLIKIEALKRADQIKSLSIIDSSSSSSASSPAPSADELEMFGVTDELREFVKEITLNTFKEFPLPDDSTMSEVPTVSNVSQDLTEWQAKHANLVISTVKEISKLRYELCPRFMKDRQFWRIYFMLVNSHIAPYEKRYIENLKLIEEQERADKLAKEALKREAVPRLDETDTSQQLKTSRSSAEQDLDAFLLGDLGDDDDDDDGPDDGDDEGFDDDLDKIADSSEEEDSKNCGTDALSAASDENGLQEAGCAITLLFLKDGNMSACSWGMGIDEAVFVNLESNVLNYLHSERKGKLSESLTVKKNESSSHKGGKTCSIGGGADGGGGFSTFSPLALSSFAPCWPSLSNGWRKL
ncbi:hypothetical protein V2J09_014908 [Rumex salicifolius]